MKDYKTILVEKNAAICTITLNRPGKLNSLNGEMTDELMGVLSDVAEDGEISVVLITGAGKAFSAGADLDWFKEIIERRKRGEGFDYGIVSSKLASTLRNMLQATIAVINGYAIGGGLTLALNCDMRIAAEEAQMSLPFISSVGITPELGSTYTLPRLVGIAKACELVFTGKAILGKEAEKIGLVNKAVPAVELRKTALEWAGAIAQGSPYALKMAKKELYRGLDENFANQVLWENQALESSFKSEDHAEAVDAFLNKRKPVFKGR